MGSTEHLRLLLECNQAGAPAVGYNLYLFAPPNLGLQSGEQTTRTLPAPLLPARPRPSPPPRRPSTQSPAVLTNAQTHDAKRRMPSSRYHRAAAAASAGADGIKVAARAAADGPNQRAGSDCVCFYLFVRPCVIAVKLALMKRIPLRCLCCDGRASWARTARSRTCCNAPASI